MSSRARDPFWRETGRRPERDGLAHRAPRNGWIALCCAVASVVLLDLAWLSGITVSAFEDLGDAPVLIWFWLGGLEAASIAAWVATIVFGFRGSRAAERSVVWAFGLAAFLVVGVFARMILVIGFLVLGVWFASAAFAPLHKHKSLHPYPDERRALFSLAMSVWLGVLHGLIWTLVVLSVNSANPPG